MHRSRLIAVVLVPLVALGLASVQGSAASSSPTAEPAKAKPVKPHKRVCASKPGKQAACDAEVITEADGVTPLGNAAPAAGSYGPADIQSAYSLPAATAGAGQTVGIVDAFDNPNAEADLAAYRAQYGLPPCTTGNGCFRKVNQNGAASPLPRGDTGWGQEIALDLDAVSSACPLCNIVLVETNSDLLDDLGVGVDRAATMGANAIGNSYSAGEWSSEEAQYGAHYNHPGVALTASTGDNGYGVGFPAVSQHVTAVGGTTLNPDSSDRGWSETAWSGSGSGCSLYIAKPAWQTDTGCSRRTVADVSAVADPNTGLAVYDSYGSGGAGNWYLIGGTSLSAPLIAATYALGANPAANTPAYPYSHPGSLWDVVSGTNGSCGGSYLCTAKPGFDGPTGLGTPHVTGAFGGPDSPVPTTTTSSTSSTSSSTTTTTIAPVPPPSGLKATPAMTSVGLTWIASPGTGITNYLVYRNNVVVGSPSGTSFSDTGLPPNTSYTYAVSAVDSTGRESAKSSAVSTKTLPDKVVPTTPTGVVVTDTQTTSASIAWNGSTDNYALAGYHVYRNGTLVGTTPPGTLSFTDNGPLKPKTTYKYTVRAYDTSNNLSGTSVAVYTTTLADTLAPDTPVLTKTAMTATSASFSWSRVWDNVGVTSYKLFMDDVLVKSTTGTTYTKGGLTPGRTYLFVLRAYDAAGNFTPSDPVYVTPA